MTKRKPGRPKTHHGPRIYQRKGRYYGDFRAYSEVGGGREALSEPGQSWATTDGEIAEVLFAKRLEELRDMRAGRAGAIRTKTTTLGKLAAEHLRKKKKAGRVTDSHIKNTEYELRRALDYFGRDRDPRTIEPEDVQGWAEHLAKRSNRRGGTLGPTTIRHHLMALSDLYGRAIEGLYVPPHYNPVSMLKEKPPTRTAQEAAFFEVAEAALILEAARVVEARVERKGKAAEGLHAIVATMLLTGGRKSEVLGLDVEDIRFDQGKVRFRPNAHRRLKTRTSHRVVPLWPQLRTILQEFMFAGDTPRTSGLLFTSWTGGMVGDMRKSLDAMAELCGMEEGDIRTKAFRHTYCSARLQTVQRIIKPGKDPAVDDDAYEWVEVSKFTVQKEMGHGGAQLVDRIYGHAHDNPHRSEVVEYQVEKHREELGERLKAVEVAG